MPDEIELFTWWLPADMAHNRPRRTKSRWKMTREEATRYPGAECIESSREVRRDTREEATRYPGAECIESSREVHRDTRGDLTGRSGGTDAGNSDSTPP
jgi:hypothetical protein